MTQTTATMDRKPMSKTSAKQPPKTAKPEEPAIEVETEVEADAEIFPPSSREVLASDIRAFLKRTGVSTTPFGVMAARDDKLLWRISTARYGISLDKADRIRCFMRVFDEQYGTGVGMHEALSVAEESAERLYERNIANGHQSRHRQQKAQPSRARRGGSVRNPSTSRRRSKKS